MHGRALSTRPPELPLDTSLLTPGLRLAVAVSGGADSVALLRALCSRAAELGLVLHVAHLHHGLRGAEADGDVAFVRELAARLGLPFHESKVDTEAEARAHPESGKAAESIEEAARRLRYGWFRQLLSKASPHAVALDAVATAHTLDDQAETVLAKLLRGAWTEGLSGIHPKLDSQEGLILRPLLAVARTEIEAYLHAIGQPWREDATNRHLVFTRNRIRHELLPLLEGWNPQLRGHLAQMAELARDEESWWRAEIAKLAAQLILPGRPVRGGGRAAGDGLAIDCSRLDALAPALQRRLLRHAAAQLGAAPDFAATESLRRLALSGPAGHKLELAQGLRAERTLRELRLAAAAPALEGKDTAAAVREYSVVIPGEIAAATFGLCLRVDATGPAAAGGESAAARRVATLRNWKPGDRVRLRYSSGPRKVKEVLERLRVTGSGRNLWPVLEMDGRIVWMKGVELEPEPGITVSVSPWLPAAADAELPNPQE
jgi:tRNA(Ile)-lysidine synthase